jgi:hypothetical protein
MMKVCLLRQQKVKELTRKTYLHHQYKSVHQKPDYSTINQTDYWEDVKSLIILLLIRPIIGRMSNV